MNTSVHHPDPGSGDSGNRDASAKFYAEYFARWPSGPQGPDRDAALKEILVRLPCVSGSLALDIGCGAGRVARLIATLFPEVKVFGVDISHEVIQQSKSLDLSRTIQFLQANELELPFRDGSFNVATCRMSIHHYPDILAHLREVRRVLAPGGTYLIIDILPEDEWEPLLNQVFTSAEIDGHGDGHLRYYTVSDLKSHLAQAGFQVASLDFSPLVFERPKSHPYYARILDAMLRTPVAHQRVSQLEIGEQTYRFVMRSAAVFAQSV